MKKTKAGDISGLETAGNLSPGMRQYMSIKARYPDAVLFFHIGDFYETFFADAELVSRELDIVLTSRSKGSNSRVPLAGVPYHAAEGYIAKLVQKGYNVAVCDQLEDAKNSKGIVRRDVVRVITPGTVIDPSIIQSTGACYLMAVCPGAGKADWGLAFLDISTGEFFVQSIAAGNPLQDLISEIARYHPAECIVPSGFPEKIIAAIRNLAVAVNPYRDDAFEEQNARSTLAGHFHVSSLAGYGCEDIPAALGAAGAALRYAQETQNSTLPHISGLSTRSTAQCMMLDATTLRNLEITEGIRTMAKGTNLLSCLDCTKTAMGSRLLHIRIVRPLIDPNEINRRLDAVEFFIRRPTIRISLRALMDRMADIGRIAGRIAYGNAGPRDLMALTVSLGMVPEIQGLVSGQGDGLPVLVRDAILDLHELPDTLALIKKAIVDDPPATAKNGGIIREGYSAELDELVTILASGKDWIVQLQEKERDRTGIKSLKIGYNRIFGYYIDVTRSNISLVPSHYERRQTTAGGERYTIPELKEKEALITNADERVLSLERDLYSALLDKLRPSVPDLQLISQGIAELDVYCALAEVAQAHNYARPVPDEEDHILIREGRHPVVERSVSGGFVPNDTDISGTGTRIMIITGANMAGKSTYMRAVALICIMAQSGCFVPAAHARIGVLDRIFTRVGAFDDLASGQSTFMVEMLELANILNNVTDRSLVILDEIGRGTSTVDGYAIAQAVVEFLHGRVGTGPKTLFATHFHELVNIEFRLKKVKNFHFAVRETKSDVIFLRKLIPGATDKSYGIHVARLAGIPKKVTERADSILTETMGRTSVPSQKVQRYTQLLLADDTCKTPFLKPDPIIDEIGAIRIDEMTPLQALTTLHELKKRILNGDNP
ncbi:MAG: DNA mismatch repair protein MutS [Methanoregula sp.]|nr:MAG: DNA mismatch repair protein MutS [Methanoregula sp.]